MLDKEVTILGGANTRALCPYNTETWGVNFDYTFAQKLDMLFFTDEEIEVEIYSYPNLERLRKLAPTLNFPIVYRKFKDFGLPIILYPFEEIKKRFKTDYFSSSIAYMIAYALFCDYKRIWMYGVEYPTPGYEYIQEKPGTEYWIGVARGMGVEVITPIQTGYASLVNNHFDGPYGQFGCKNPDPVPVFSKVVMNRIARMDFDEYSFADGWITFAPGKVISFPWTSEHPKIEVVTDNYGFRAVREI